MPISQTQPRVKDKNLGEEGKPKARRQRVLAVVCLDNTNLVIDGMTRSKKSLDNSLKAGSTRLRKKADRYRRFLRMPRISCKP